VFAEQTGSDLRALAACIRAARQVLTPADVARIEAPTLVVAGEKDEIAGSAGALAALMPNARGVTLPGRDHMTAVGDKGHKREVRAFLDNLAP
jgi:pimeloyl-ACP methyl ester carboxylesterase